MYHSYKVKELQTPTCSNFKTKKMKEQLSKGKKHFMGSPKYQSLRRREGNNHILKEDSVREAVENGDS